MSENKEYWNHTIEQGNIKIADDVVASIAALAVNEVEGVYALASGFSTEIAEFFGKKSNSKGVKTRFLDDTIEVDVFILVKYGFAICDVAKEIQTKVAHAIQDMAGLQVSSVNVNVTGIVFDEAPAVLEIKENLS